MVVSQLVFTTCALAPAASMLTAALLPRLRGISDAGLWRAFQGLSGAALVGAAVAVLAGPDALQLPTVLRAFPLGLGLTLLVQLLGLVIAGFSTRYLQGEAGQRRYIAALGGVLTAVHLLLMADHWLVLIAAWALVGAALQRLLCFYPERAFAQLAAHKKRIADRAADALLLGAAALAWHAVGSGSLSDLGAYLASSGASAALQLSAVALVLAVILRTALLPVHGWLIQVMEAPTPVSALLHAGVVNLGGFVLIRFAPLLSHVMPASALLVIFGLGTAVLAGMVMLTRISIKVRLAWSTVAQMGFMLLECGLGLYTLAALHLIGHSLYKAHSFLSASGVVREARLQALHGAARLLPVSLALAPVLTIAVVLGVVHVAQTSWPWWWSAGLGLAWAPLLWLPADRAGIRAASLHLLAGMLAVAGLSGVALLLHRLPLGIEDAPRQMLGMVALLGLAGMYFCLVTLQLRPHALRTWRRWSYAGFYVDEVYTRLALQLWPARWTPQASKTAPRFKAPISPLPDAPQ